MKQYKVAFVSLGCAKNLVNTEQMMALCREAGYEITGEPAGADVAVLNTCGFIESAKSEAIDNILELARLKDEGKLKKASGGRVSYPALPGGDQGGAARGGRHAGAPAATPTWSPPWRS